MKNIMKLSLIGLITFFALYSCNSNSSIEKDQEEKEKLDLSKNYKELFPQNATSDGVAFINQLYSLHLKVDKTTLYSEDEFQKFYTKTVKLALGEVTIEDWTASSPDLFQVEPELKEKVKDRFLNSINELIDLRLKIVKKSQEASPGNYGQIGSQVANDIRYVNGKAIEVSELVEKQVMGIILLDQILNHHLGDHVMNNSELKNKNTQKKYMNQKQYTELEYHWDVAYSLLGLDNREGKPLFISNYLINEFQGADFLKGVDKKVFDAFKKGRYALAKGEYNVVDEQIKIIRESLSKLYAARSVHYLKQAKENLKNIRDTPEYHKAFHPLSEAYGFMFAFVCTRKADGGFYIQDYNVIEKMTSEFIGTEGFWDQDTLLGGEDVPGSLDNLSKRIGEIYGFNYKEII